MAVRWWMLAICLWTAGGLSARDLVLVRKGVAQVPVVVAADAPRATRQAAEELAGYLEKISGARPDVVIVAEASLSEGAVWVGAHAALSELFPGADLELRHPEETLQLCNGRHLALLGRDRFAGSNQVEFGTANAVYAFVEKRLGVRWLWPGELGEDVPLQATVAVPAFDEERFHPPLRMRNIRTGSRGWRYDPLIVGWFRHQRSELDSAHFNAGHSFTDWWEKHHEAHPEWFALRGKAGRTPEKWGKTPNPHAVKLCVSNPEVAEQWLRDAVDLFEREPERFMLGATPNDGGGFCTCENCRAWDAPDGPKVWNYVALTDRYVKFWNILARGLKERFPVRDVRLGAYGYSAYATPPMRETLEPNIVVAYVGSFPLNPPAVREEQRQVWKAWAERASMLWYRPNLWYWGGGIWGMPEVAMRHTAEDFRFLAENRCVGLEVDGYRGYWATQGPQYYLMTKVAYDPFLDAKATMRDYYRRGFGPASRQIEDYWTLLEDAYDRMLALPEFKIGSGKRYELPPTFAKIYDEQLLGEAESLLTKAAENASRDPGVYGDRVAFVRSGFEYLRLLVRTIPLMTRARESGGKDREAVLGAVENWAGIERVVGEAGVLGMGYYGYITNCIGGAGYMGQMQDHLGPPSEELRKAAYAGPEKLDPGLGRE